MFAVAYTVRMVPDVDWDGAIEFIKKLVDICNRDDNGMTACRALVPADGLRRVTYLCDFATFEDSNNWPAKASDEWKASAEEGRKYFVSDHKTTRYWTV